MLTSIAGVVSIYVNQASLEKEKLLIITDLVNQIRDNVQIPERGLI